MTECKYNHEDFCILDVFMPVNPCKLAKGKAFKKCTARDEDLIDCEE